MDGTSVTRLFKITKFIGMLVTGLLREWRAVLACNCSMVLLDMTPASRLHAYLCCCQFQMIVNSSTHLASCVLQ
jgi:hypothetical protein